MDFFKRYFGSRRPTAVTIRRRNTGGNGPRLRLEALEERTLLNNRFVVPVALADNVSKFADLQAALIQPGLSAGDIIQIEPSSAPGGIINANLPAVQNLTIQGDPAFDVQAIPSFAVNDAVTITSAQQGFTLKNVQVSLNGGGLLFNADGNIVGARIADFFAGDAIDLTDTSAAVISNSYIESDNPNANIANLVFVAPAAGSHNLITGNQFNYVKGNALVLLDYVGGAGSTDLVANNRFLGKVGPNGAPMLVVAGNTQGLTIEGNTFSDSDAAETAISVAPPAQNLQILDNVISFPNGVNGFGISVASSQQPVFSSLVIANNHINTGGQGTGIEFQASAPGVIWTAKVEGNDLHGNLFGVGIDAGQGGSVAGIDLGGGNQASKGANNFRGLGSGSSYAIDVTAFSSAGPVQATGNIFSVADPTTVIYDHNNDPSKAAVLVTNPLTGNAVFVETLYLDFLHRTGDLNNLNDAGGWVAFLGQGASAAAVANDIARSSESLGLQVDALYHRFLKRDADAAGRASFVALLQNGGTLEGVSQIMLASPEYQIQFPTDAAFVQSLYQNLLQRTPASAEVNGWLGKLPQLGRAGVAQAFLHSTEYRNLAVAGYYADLLHRTATPSAQELSGWVNSPSDLLAIEAAFAGSPEFQVNG